MRTQRLIQVKEEYPNNPYPDGKLPEALKRHVFFGGIGNGQPKKRAPKKRAPKKRAPKKRD